MSRTPKCHNGCGGFSLVEALVALAIMAVLTAALTRLIVTTRVNAARIGEMTEMATLGETLLARVSSSQGLRLGRTDGRSGAFAWHIEVAPVSFTAVARRKTEMKDAQPAAAEKAGASAKAPAGPGATSVPAARAQHWVTYRVAVVVEAPSGRTYGIDTIKIGPQAEKDDQ